MAPLSTMHFVQRLCYSLVSGALILITLYLVSRQFLKNKMHINDFSLTQYLDQLATEKAKKTTHKK